MSSTGPNLQLGDLLDHGDGLLEMVAAVDAVHGSKAASCGCCSEDTCRERIWVFSEEPVNVILEGGSTAKVLPLRESYGNHKRVLRGGRPLSSEGDKKERSMEEFIAQRIRNILRYPATWGLGTCKKTASPEAVEAQLLLLIEMYHICHGQEDTGATVQGKFHAFRALRQERGISNGPMTMERTVLVMRKFISYELNVEQGTPLIDSICPYCDGEGCEECTEGWKRRR